MLKLTGSVLRGKLAILVPTYRFDARARHTLAATAALANDDVAVLIADNSENREKWTYLEKLSKLHSNVHLFCHKKNIGAFRNWTFLFQKTDLDSYLVVSDDDFCTPAYVECGLRLLQQHADASAAAGSFLMVTSSNKLALANSARMEATAYERCTNFRIGGGNSLPNSMARRSAVQPFLEYINSHPLRASFFDWFMAFMLLSQGKYYTENAGQYLYDISNWEDGRNCWDSNAKFYVAAGLPESFTWFHELYWGIESVHLFTGAYSPIADTQQRRDSAQFFYVNRIGEFRRLMANPPSASTIERLVSHRVDAVEALRALVANDDAFHPLLFSWFARILAAFDAECALAYADYVRASIERAAVGGDAAAVR